MAGCRRRHHAASARLGAGPPAGCRGALAATLGWWWLMRGRLGGEYPLLCEAAGRTGPGSKGPMVIANRDFLGISAAQTRHLECSKKFMVLSMMTCSGASRASGTGGSGLSRPLSSAWLMLASARYNTPPAAPSRSPGLASQPGIWAEALAGCPVRSRRKSRTSDRNPA